MSKQFWGVIIAIILVFVGVAALSGNKSSNGSGGKSSGSSAVTQHIEGQGKSGVTLVEYGDFQCPYCGQYYPIVKQVVEQNKEQIRFQFRNFPLVSLHRNAFAAARAAEAAGLQNKYWEMNGALYQSQRIWSESNDPMSFFSQYAQQIGLDVTKFKKDYASSQVNDAINADMAAGNKLKITGTPTFFLDGKKVEVSQSVDSFQKLIDAAIAKKKP
jgi:protein-disulfide isomerase